MLFENLFGNISANMRRDRLWKLFGQHLQKPFSKNLRRIIFEKSFGNAAGNLCHVNINWEHWQNPFQKNL